MNAYVRTTGNGYKVMCVNGAKVLGGNFRNFSGKNQYDDSDGGTRYFNIQVDEEFVQIMKDFGCDVKWYERYGIYHLKCIVSWKLRDPDVYIVSNNMIETKQTEETIGDLDHVNNIDFVDMELSISHWKNPLREGISTYASGVYFYLGQSYSSEQLYNERRTAYQAQQPEPVQMEFTPVEDEDIPF